MRGGVELVGDEGELGRAREQDVEGGLELEARGEDGRAAQDVETEAGARERDC